MFRNVTAKLANMRKSADWVVYPVSDPASRERIIQADRRMAKINLDTRRAVVSDGKRSSGFLGLQPILGAVEVDCPDDLIQQLENLDADHGVQSGPVNIFGGSVMARQN